MRYSQQSVCTIYYIIKYILLDGRTLASDKLLVVRHATLPERVMFKTILSIVVSRALELYNIIFTFARYNKIIQQLVLRHYTIGTIILIYRLIFASYFFFIFFFIIIVLTAVPIDQYIIVNRILTFHTHFTTPPSTSAATDRLYTSYISFSRTCV